MRMTHTLDWLARFDKRFYFFEQFLSAKRLLEKTADPNLVGGFFVHGETKAGAEDDGQAGP